MDSVLEVRLLNKSFGSGFLQGLLPKTSKVLKDVNFDIER